MKMDKLRYKQKIKKIEKPITSNSNNNNNSKHSENFI